MGFFHVIGYKNINAAFNKQDIGIQLQNGYNLRDGYAFALCCALANHGVNATVWAHLTRGHLTRNPHVVSVRHHLSMTLKTVSRGRIIYPRANTWKKWKRDLKGPLRFTFWR